MQNLIDWLLGRYRTPEQATAESGEQKERAQATPEQLNKLLQAMQTLVAQTRSVVSRLVLPHLPSLVVPPVGTTPAALQSTASVRVPSPPSRPAEIIQPPQAAPSMSQRPAEPIQVPKVAPQAPQTIVREIAKPQPQIMQPSVELRIPPPQVPRIEAPPRASTQPPTPVSQVSAPEYQPSTIPPPITTVAERAPTLAELTSLRGAPAQPQPGMGQTLRVQSELYLLEQIRRILDDIRKRLVAGGRQVTVSRPQKIEELPSAITPPDRKLVDSLREGLLRPIRQLMSSVASKAEQQEKPSPGGTAVGVAGLAGAATARATAAGTAAAGAAGGGLGGALVAVGIALAIMEVLRRLKDAFNALVEGAVRTSRELAKFSGPLALAEARLQIAERMNQLYMARATQATGVELLEARRRMLETWQPIVSGFANLRNEIATIWTEVKTTIGHWLSYLPFWPKGRAPGRMPIVDLLNEIKQGQFAGRRNWPPPGQK